MTGSNPAFRGDTPAGRGRSGAGGSNAGGSIAVATLSDEGPTPWRTDPQGAERNTWKDKDEPSIGRGKPTMRRNPVVTAQVSLLSAGRNCRPVLLLHSL